ncbi:hypothetical protein B0H14DRAFT_2859332 [Mycena olivaceomarginata]|nr:hypothetical protein B0H14DRAFT_2859332 [Mycena olivaceomarginata]
MSKVVFAGNLPYNMSEEELIDVFKVASEVVGFRLAFNRNTGQPHGYGFCELPMDGRALRCSLADSDPYLEGKTTVRGEIPLGADEKAQDAITYAIAHMDRSRLIEAFVITYPKRARQFLSHHPQVAYAVTIPENILSPMLEGSHDAMREASHAAMHPVSDLHQHSPPPPPSQNFGPPPPQHQHQAYPPSPSRLQQPKLVQGMMPPGMAAPSPGPMRPPPYQQPQPSQAASYQLQNGSGDAQNAQTSHSIVLTSMPTPITELTAAQRVAIESLRKMLLANRG